MGPLLNDARQLESHEGQCGDAERHARSPHGAALASEKAAIRLAGAIHRRGASMESVHAALDGAWPLAQGKRRGAVHWGNEELFQVLAGHFASAAQAADAWARPSRTTCRRIRTWNSRSPISNGDGARDRPRAARLASEYLAKRDAWVASAITTGDIGTSHAIPRRRPIARRVRDARQAWLARQAQRSPLASAAKLQWTAAYALAVATPEDAREALRVLPRYCRSSTPSRAMPRWTAASAACTSWRETSSTPGVTSNAPRSSCEAVQTPFEHTWAHLHLGMALQQGGDVAGACAAYEVVLSRWGNEPRSESAKTARARRNAIAMRDAVNGSATASASRAAGRHPATAGDRPAA